ncbi:MAG: hypothetical protein NZ924_06440 [Candidatus Bipolaricaulota bacterium]|nr:hypothetical protein [Candidatus Bipolaricaulota bacterium]MDW8152518.1 hypothetical protein [Candidatus Bipolaricaulota bacterium]
MVGFLVGIVVLLAGAGLLSFWRARRQIVRLQTKLQAAWQEVEQGFALRLQALEELAEALQAAGYAPEGQERLRKALAELRAAQGGDPEKIAEADERVEAALRGIYRALPREREARVRQAQNRLAQADEELDIRKSRYNELVLTWYKLTQRFPYRYAARKFPKPALLAVPGEEAELLRRTLAL